MNEKELKSKAIERVIKFFQGKGVKLRRFDFNESELDFKIDKNHVICYRNCVRTIKKSDEIIGVIVKVAYTGRWEKQLKSIKDTILNYPNIKEEENHVLVGFMKEELEEDCLVNTKSYEQINIFDLMQESMHIPIENNEGCILGKELIPIRWERWQHTTERWKDCGHDGGYHIINACLIVFPGNRLYVKEWFAYPSMYQLKSSKEVDKMYTMYRKKIMEWAGENNSKRWTWEVDETPLIEDMWKFEEGAYSVKEYADKMKFGYNLNCKEKQVVCGGM